MVGGGGGRRLKEETELGVVEKAERLRCAGEREVF